MGKASESFIADRACPSERVGRWCDVRRLTLENKGERAVPAQASRNVQHATLTSGELERAPVLSGRVLRPKLRGIGCFSHVMSGLS